MTIALKDIVLAGLGALAFSQEKVQEVLRDLVKRGEITREQAEGTLAEFSKRGAKESEELGSRLGDLVSRAVSAMDYARKGDLEKLAERVRALEERLPE